MNPREQCDGRRRMVPARSAVPGPLYSLESNERASGCRQSRRVVEITGARLE